MRFAVFVILVGVPLLEIVVFIEVGGLIGLWPTIGLVVLTALAGTTLLRSQGLAILNRAGEALARNEAPVAEVFHGLCLVFAGALLLTPGFLTDAAGLLIFIPAVRAAIMGRVWRYLRTRGRADFSFHRERRHGTGEDVTIDTEYYEVHRASDEDTDQPPVIETNKRPPGKGER